MSKPEDSRSQLLLTDVEKCAEIGSRQQTVVHVIFRVKQYLLALSGDTMGPSPVNFRITFSFNPRPLGVSHSLSIQIVEVFYA
jgi:hypothetical protein